MVGAGHYRRAANAAHEASALSDESEQRALVAKLREEAAALGADGLIVGEFHHTAPSDPTHVQATAIWIPADSAAASSACGPG